MRRISIMFILLAFVALAVGCAGSEGIPTAPDLSGVSGYESNPDTTSDGDKNIDDSEGTPVEELLDLTEENEHPLQGQKLQGSHALWGLYQIIIDPAENTLEIVPLRGANLHLNALKFLEPGGAYGMVQLASGLDWNGDKTLLDLDIRLVHPFVGLDHFSGFDVKGILIPKATMSGFSDPDLVTSSASDLKLLNADGYTRWWNPREFPGNNIFSYTDGALGMKDEVFGFESTLNGFKYFCDGLDPDDPVTALDPALRGSFKAGNSNIRHYTLAVPDFPTSLIFNYAIDASWEPPLVKPPDVPDDFPPEANQPEPFAIVELEIVNTLYYDDIVMTQGGLLNIQIAVYDWQSALPAPGGSIERIVGEWPGLFDATEADYVSDEGDYAIWEITLVPQPGVLTSTDDLNYMIWAESTDGSGYGGILDPGIPLIAANLFTATVASEEPNVAPLISSGVTGNASPGLTIETYTVVAFDPNGDDLTYKWICAPLLSDDPGNGDGTIDIDWAPFGFGDFTVECLVTDSINPDVAATPLEVSVGNIPPFVGPITGPTDVSAADTAANYSAIAGDPDFGQTIEYTWSFVPDGDPDDFIIPGDLVDGSMTVDFSAVDPGLYSINVQVTDGFEDVDGIAISVTHNNTPPTVGQVTGKTPVYDSDTDEVYLALWSDPDTTQTLSFRWSVVPEGDPEDFSIPGNPDGSVNIDWSAYSGGFWDVNLQADDGIDVAKGTLLTIERIDNLPPTVEYVTGPTPVYHTTSAADYNAVMADPNGDTLTVLWSIVPHGDAPDYSIPGTEGLPLTVDWADYIDLGDYDVNVQVDDSFYPPVEGTLLVVTIDNTPPTTGAITGPAAVDISQTENYYINPPVTDCDTTQTITFDFSIQPTGLPFSYDISSPTDDIDVDWMVYGVGMWTIGCEIYDGIDYVYATALDVVVTLPPCSGSAHTYLDTLTPNSYSIAPMSIIPRADISFLESGIGGIDGYCVAQIGPSTLGVFDADSTGATSVPFEYFLGKKDTAVSIDTDLIQGRILVVTAQDPNIIKIIDSSIIMGNCIIGQLYSGDPDITFVAVDVEADGDIWAVARDATSGIEYRLVRFLYDDVDPDNPPYYTFDPVSTLDITTWTGTESDIFDIAINHQANMLYLLEAGPVGQGRMILFMVQDGFAAAFMGILGDVLFSQPLDYDESSFTGFAGYADIDIDHVDASDERCRILLYGRLEDQSSELIRMESDSYLVLDVQNYVDAWPAFAINPDADPGTRNLIMPGTDWVAFWDTPVDW